MNKYDWSRRVALTVLLASVWGGGDRLSADGGQPPQSGPPLSTHGVSEQEPVPAPNPQLPKEVISELREKQAGLASGGYQAGTNYPVVPYKGTYSTTSYAAEGGATSPQTKALTYKVPLATYEDPQTAKAWGQTYSSVLKAAKKERWFAFGKQGNEVNIHLRKQEFTSRANQEEAKRCIEAFNALPASERLKAYRQVARKRDRASATMKSGLSKLKFW